jgi:phage gpG-like protein
VSLNATINVRIEDTAGPALAALKQLAAQPQQVLREMGQNLAANRMMRFEGGYGPNRVPWTPSIRAKEAGGKTLVDRGLLRDSVVAQEPEVQGNTVTLSTNMPYAAVHEFGATIKAVQAQALAFALPGGGFAMVKQVTIPARPFMGLDRQDVEDCEDVVREHIARILGRGGAA